MCQAEGRAGKARPTVTPDAPCLTYILSISKSFEQKLRQIKNAVNLDAY